MNWPMQTGAARRRASRLHGAACAAVVGAAAALTAPQALAQSVAKAPTQAPLAAFDFNYTSRGDTAVRPVQVFDDGTNTYLQLRPGASVPAIFAVPSMQMVQPFAAGPYTGVPGRAQQYVLVLGDARAQVVHASLANAPDLTGPRRDPNMQRQALWDAAIVAARRQAPDGTRNSYATPVKGDVLEWKQEGSTLEQPVLFEVGHATVTPAARRAIEALVSTRLASGSTAITVIGRSDRSEKEGLAERRAEVLRDVLIGAGVSPARVRSQVGAEIEEGKKFSAATIRWTTARVVAATLPTPTPMVPGGAAPAPAPTAAVAPAPAPVLREYAMASTDGAVEKAMARWAKAEDVRFEWTAPSAALTGEATLRAASFAEAARQIVDGLREAGYPVVLVARDGLVAVKTKE